MTVEPYRIHVTDERLAAARRASAHHGLGRRGRRASTTGSYGVPGAYLRELVAYWRDGYDWRAHEAAMNRWPHVRGEIDGVTVHALHERGSGPGAAAARAHPRVAVDVLGLRRGDRAARAPRALRRRSRRRVRRGRAVAPGFGVLVAVARGSRVARDRCGCGCSSWPSSGYDRFGAHGGDSGAYVERAARARVRRPPDRRAPDVPRAARRRPRVGAPRRLRARRGRRLRPAAHHRCTT